MKGFSGTGLAFLMTLVSSGFSSTPGVSSGSLAADTLTAEIGAKFKNNSTTTDGMAAKSDYFGHHGYEKCHVSYKTKCHTTYKEKCNTIYHVVSHIKYKKHCSKKGKDNDDEYYPPMQYADYGYGGEYDIGHHFSGYHGGRYSYGGHGGGGYGYNKAEIERSFSEDKDKCDNDDNRRTDDKEGDLNLGQARSDNQNSNQIKAQERFLFNEKKKCKCRHYPYKVHHKVPSHNCKIYPVKHCINHPVKHCDHHHHESHGGYDDYHYDEDHHYRSDNGPEARETANQKNAGSNKKTLFGRFSQSLGNRFADSMYLHTLYLLRQKFLGCISRPTLQYPVITYPYI